MELVHEHSLKVKLKALALEGKPAAEAAALLQCPPETVEKVYADGEFRAELLAPILRALGITNTPAKRRWPERLAESAEKAFDVLDGMLDDTAVPSGVKAKVAQDFLDRNEGTQASRKIEHTFKLDDPALKRALESARHMDAHLTHTLEKQPNGEYA
jgi:hypothetical protein